MASSIYLVNSAIDYIETHLDKKLDLDTVAAAIHYSRYHLHHVFSAAVGFTIREYVVRRKLTEAAKLLVFSEKPIIDIAVIAGYETQQAFSASFREMYKLSPNQYRERGVFYPLQLRFSLKQNPTLNHQEEEYLEKRIVLAEDDDIPLWMALVRTSVDGFPCLKEDSYLSQLKSFIKEKRALLIKDEDMAVGALIFNPENGSIDFMAVHPQYRKSGIARAFLNRLMTDYLKEREITITTFREGDKADTGYREEYRRLGFAESRLLVEFGYPTQEFRLCSHIQQETKQETGKADEKAAVETSMVMADDEAISGSEVSND